MKSRRKYLLLFLMALVSAGLTKASKHEPQAEPQPAVIKAVAPNTYPPIAIAARAEGRVVVEVKIDASGKVISALAVEGHALLRKVAEDTAGRWLFEAATTNSQQRVARLIFIFHVASKFEKAEVVFSPPYQVEVTFQPPAMVDTVTY